LRFSSPTGLNEAYMFSSFGKAESFAIAIEKYQGQLHELARRTSHMSVSDAPSLVSAPAENEPLKPDTAPVIPLARRWMFLDRIVVAMLVLIVGFGTFWAVEFFDVRGLTKVSAPPQSADPMPSAKAPVAKEPAPIVARPSPKVPKSTSEPAAAA